MKNAIQRASLLLAICGVAASGSAQTWNLEYYSPSTLPTSHLTAAGELLVAWNDNGGRYARFGVESQTLDVQRISSPAQLQLSSIAADSLGRTIVSGHLDGKPWIAAVDAGGTVAWSDTASSALGDYPTLLPLSNGDVIAGGSRLTSSGLDGILTRYDAQGNALWRRAYSVPKHSDTIRDAVETSDGGLLLVSHVVEISGSDGWMVTRIAPQGFTLWQRYYKTSVDLWTPSVCVGPDDEFYIAGVRRLSANNTSIGVARFDSSGNILWSNYYLSFPGNSLAQSLLQVQGIAMRPGGGVGVLAAQPMSRATAEEDLALLLLDEDGFRVSYRSYGNTTLHETAAGLHATEGDGFAVVGTVGNTMRAMRVDRYGDAGCRMLPDIYISKWDMPLTKTTVAHGYMQVVAGVTTSPISVNVRTLSTTLRCSNLCRVFPVNYGAGSPGSGGITPQLKSTNGYCVNNTPVVTLDRAVGGASGVLLFAGTSASVPLFGGTLLVDPSLLITLPIGTNGTAGAAGVGSYQFRTPGNLTSLAGQSFFVQAVLIDLGAPTTLAMTDAIEFVVF